MPQPLQLDYAPAPDSARRVWRRALRRLTKFMLVAGLAAVALGIAWQAYLRAQRMVFAMHVRHWQPPPTQLAYGDFASDQGWLDSKDYQFGSGLHGQTAAELWPSWLDAQISDRALEIPFPARQAWPKISTACIFAGKLFGPDGARLVVLIRPDARLWDSPTELAAMVWSCDVLEGSGRPATTLLRPPWPVEGLRIFAGQGDRDDASHFTIRYRANDTDFLVDGYLTKGDQIVLEPREHASTRP